MRLHADARGTANVRTIVVALAVTTFDVTMLVVGLRENWFTGGALLLSAWAQSAIVVLVAPAMFLSAASKAPDVPVVNAMPRHHLEQKAARQQAQRMSGEQRGRSAALSFTGFFALHYGIFMAAIGFLVVGFVFTDAGFGEPLAFGVLLLAARTVLASVPSMIADVRFLRDDNYSFLMGRTLAVASMAYRRMLPLHVGIIGLGFLTINWWPYAVVAIIGGTSFVGAIWPYPTTEQLADRSLPPGARLEEAL